MGKYRHYLETHPSGIDWVGDIPAHWSTRRVKFLFRRMQRLVREQDNVVTAFRDGQVTLRSNRRTEGFTNSVKEIGYQGIRKGDLVVHAMDGFAGAIGVSDSDGKCSPVYSVCIPESSSDTSTDYYGRLLRNMAISGFVTALAKGIRERSTEFRYNELKELEVPVPPQTEQDTIVQFLDHETAKIDRLIAKQERLIELLKEKRQAVISHAVTKGLNPPDAPMKDSGVEWLGEVPAHWTVCKFSHHIAFQEGPGIMADDFRDSGVPLLRIHNIKPDFIELERCNFLDPEKVRIRWSHFRLEKGDLVISASATTGIVSEVGDEAVGAIPYTGLIRLKPGTQMIRQKFIKNLVVSGLFTTQIDLLIAGATIGHFGPTHLRQMVIALPPAEEQERIVDYIAHECSLIDKTIAKCTEAVTLQNEHRIALISAAVTGKIDMRGWQKPNTEPTKTATAVSA